MCKLSLNQNLTCKYNASDDFLYVLLNGTWQKTRFKCGLQKIYAFLDGEWMIEHSENTPNFTYYPNEGTFSVVGNKLVVSAPTKAKSRAVQFAIENNGNPIVFKYTLNGVENTVSLASDYNTTYVCIWSYTDSGGAPQVGYIGFYKSQQTSASWPNKMSDVKRSDVINWQISEIYADI